ncbi:DUF3617 domain-containing protein [Cellvibrio sp. OA-2007]|uniref:DUF3617 domain-containing protein n=1 Tax=Cellvibrio sp. OA-2007 TaxID=529823 RepID=UPI0007830684|nr:DUF3617 domain-containing protein [Cellvibrio sp. OA-2007]
MKTLLSVFVIALGVAVVPLQAEPVKVDMKAGLWENTMTWDVDSAKEIQALQADQMEYAMAQMKEQFANMPPEQRKQMEVITAQMGIKVSDEDVSFQNDQVQISTQGTTAKSCVTQAEIDRGELPDEVDGCKSTLKQLSKNRFKSTHFCAGDEQASGESEVVFDSPKHYTGTGKMNQTIDGKSHTMAFKIAGTWLSSDCTSVKPNR